MKKIIENNPVVKAKEGAEKRTFGQRGGFRSANTFSQSDRPPEFDSKLLDLARVTRVAAGGRRFRFRAVVVIGNKQGKVGVGVAKGLDVAQAVEKATRLAKKNLIQVPIIENTIPHEVSAKFGPARVLLLPKRKGRGLVAGGTVRVICTLSGIKNISSKILGRTGNKLNNARATIEALKKLKTHK
jgi:small subunit ribosomal protein S5